MVANRSTIAAAARALIPYTLMVPQMPTMVPAIAGPTTREPFCAMPLRLTAAGISPVATRSGISVPIDGIRRACPTATRPRPISSHAGVMAPALVSRVSPSMIRQTHT